MYFRRKSPAIDFLVFSLALVTRYREYIIRLTHVISYGDCVILRFSTDPVGLLAALVIITVIAWPAVNVLAPLAVVFVSVDVTLTAERPVTEVPAICTLAVNVPVVEIESR